MGLAKSDRLFILIMACIIAYPSYYIGRIIFELVRLDALDQTEVRDSPFLGRSVRIAPFAKFYYMKNWSGWTDKYMHILLREPSKSEEDGTHRFYRSISVDSNGYWDLEITQVLHKTSGMGLGGKTIICILENKRNHKEVFSVDCSEINWMNAFTQVYVEFVKEINQKGSAYLLHFKPSGAMDTRIFKNEESIFSFNGFEVFPLNNVEGFLKYIKNEGGFSYSEAYQTLPEVMKGREKLNETQMAKIYFGSTDLINFCHGRHDRCETLSEIMSKNYVSTNVEKWIKSNFQDDVVKRWALRIIAIELRKILIKRSIKSRDIRWDLSRHEDLVNCFRRYFVDEDLAKINESLQSQVFKEEDFEKEWARIQNINKSFDPTYTIGNLSCRLFPPKFRGNGEFILSE